MAQGLRFGKIHIAEKSLEFGAEPTGMFWILAPFGPISKETMLNIA
jgi:hypothetical protein